MNFSIKKSEKMRNDQLKNPGIEGIFYKEVLKNAKWPIEKLRVDGIFQKKVPKNAKW